MYRSILMCICICIYIYMCRRTASTSSYFSSSLYSKVRICFKQLPACVPGGCRSGRAHLRGGTEPSCLGKPVDEHKRVLGGIGPHSTPSIQAQNLVSSCSSFVARRDAAVS